MSAVLLGSVAPDAPLYMLSFGGAAWFRFVEGWEWPQIFPHMFSKLFYEDPWWISLHNCLHSPLAVGSALVALLAWKGRAQFWQSWWAWFFLSCLLHTLVDIPVHHDDGPLVFWPLNWNYRFASPVSYWDRAHYADVVMPAEAALTLGLLGKLIVERMWFAKR